MSKLTLSHILMIVVFVGFLGALFSSAASAENNQPGM
jgi:hypothetical protein